MVHADVDVASRGQALNGQLQQFQFALGRRHVLGANQLLRAHQIRQVRVAVRGDAVRADVDDLAQRGIEAGDGLQGQAVDQVDADRLEAGITGGLDQFAGLLFGLDAVDCDLHLLVEVLHTEAQAVEAELAQAVDLLGGDGARVHLKGELVAVAVIHVERLMQACHQVGQLFAGEIGRCATAQVQLGQLARAVEQRTLHGDLALEVLEVLDGALGLVGDDLVAGAVVAQALAERDVDVHRQRLGRLRLIAARSGSAVVVLGEGLMELRGSRVGRVAWTGTVVFLDQGPVEARQLVHCSFHLRVEFGVGSGTRCHPRVFPAQAGHGRELWTIRPHAPTVSDQE